MPEYNALNYQWNRTSGKPEY